MKVYYSLNDFDPLNFGIVTIGTFDGVHIGHKKILDKLNQVAKKFSGESVLLTFYPHPRKVIQPDMELKMLNSQQEKIDQLKECGIDHLIIHPFTQEFGRTNSLDFIKEILVAKIGVKKLVIGYDHHFGKNREGSFKHLKENGPIYGFDVEEISAQDIDETTVSSTKIRLAIETGNLEKANAYLGYKYPLTGTVVQGEQLGQQLGYPTANILLDDNDKLIPANGVYAVEVFFVAESSKKLFGMCNIGVRPTFGGKFQTIEVNIFDFNEVIYGKMLKLRFVKKLRDERAFENRDELINQLAEDEKQSRKLLGLD